MKSIKSLFKVILFFVILFFFSNGCVEKKEISHDIELLTKDVWVSDYHDTSEIACTQIYIYSTTGNVIEYIYYHDDVSPNPISQESTFSYELDSEYNILYFFVTGGYLDIEIITLTEDTMQFEMNGQLEPPYYHPEKVTIPIKSQWIVEETYKDLNEYKGAKFFFNSQSYFTITSKEGTENYDYKLFGKFMPSSFVPFDGAIGDWLWQISITDEYLLMKSCEKNPYYLKMKREQ